VIAPFQDCILHHITFLVYTCVNFWCLCDEDHMVTLLDVSLFFTVAISRVHD
jgi:hypothetical protein